MRTYDDLIGDKSIDGWRIVEKEGNEKMISELLREKGRKRSGKVLKGVQTY